MLKSNLGNLLDQIQNSTNTALIVGAGISVDQGIPAGYKLPIAFAEDHQSLIKQLGLEDKWLLAIKAKEKKRWHHEGEFVRALVQTLPNSSELQEAIVHWMISQPDKIPMQGKLSHNHSVFSTAWLKGVLRHLITTNWDFLLEWQIDAIYDQAYNNPFDAVELNLPQGQRVSIEAEKLFYLNHLDGDDFFWHPRWNIAASTRDLREVPRWSKTLWKIHGSPFFLACPKCSGTNDGQLNRWKTEENLHVGDFCPTHPDTRLTPEITFWGQSIDISDVLLWQTVRNRLRRCNLIIVCGFSGTGSDTYIRRVVESHHNAWLVNPNWGSWNIKNINYVEGTSSDLADLIVRTIS